MWAVRPPPQNLVKAKELGGGLTARKSPIRSTNNQWGGKVRPFYHLMKTYSEFQNKEECNAY
ncbi:hypothetical protein CN550_01335 [Bacillus pseudomycoides]|nr:hypothetical protein CN550_01335 [Bacillus pseudomycoides]